VVYDPVPPTDRLAKAFTQQWMHSGLPNLKALMPAVERVRSVGALMFT
jgi:hypothetical protein